MTRATRAAQVLLVLTLAWGSFAFGGAYEWASRPMAAGSAAAALLAIASTRGRSLQLWPLAGAAALVVIAATLQLVPVPVTWLQAWTPATLEAASQLDVLFVASGSTSRPISIHPAATRQGVLLAASCLLLVFGTARLCSVTGTRWLLAAITVLGVLLSVVGVIQDVMNRGVAWNEMTVYGFWRPMNKMAVPFGPFINRNHFGGWAMMALPLALALACARAAGGVRSTRGDWRGAVGWLSTRDGSMFLLAAIGAFTIALGLVLTRSRSAMLGAVIGLFFLTVASMRRSATSGGRLFVGGGVVLLIVLVVAAVGSDAVATRFAALGADDIGRRAGAWADARAIAGRFPVTGTGLNTYGTATLLYQRPGLEHHYAQAHNDYLQLAAEGGLMLGVPAFAAIAVFVATVRRRLREPSISETAWWARTGALAGLLAIALQEVVEFSLQMPANAALAAVLSGIALHRVAPRERVGRAPAMRRPPRGGGIPQRS